MSSTNNRGTISAMVLGGIGIISVSVLVYFFFMRTPTFKAIKLEGEGAPKDDSSSSPPPKKKDVYEPPRSTDSKKASTEAAVVVDDDDDDEEEEEDEDAAAVAALKAKFDDANRMASKLIQGQAYERAVEKLTEALDLAPQVPGAAKHIVTLYNNRSAMYEKIKAYDKAMSDITVVLAMDMLHTKVHIRRARICEAQVRIFPSDIICTVFRKILCSQFI